MWRVIVRLSCTSDNPSRLRNHVAALLTAMGLQNTATGTWESQAVPLGETANRLCQVLQALADPQAIFLNARLIGFASEEKRAAAFAKWAKFAAGAIPGSP